MNSQQNVSEKGEAENTTEYNLSEREIQVLNYLVDGLEYKEISAEMDLSPHTVRNHIAHCFIIRFNAKFVIIFNGFSCTNGISLN